MVREAIDITAYLAVSFLLIKMVSFAMAIIIVFIISLNLVLFAEEVFRDEAFTYGLLD